MSSRWPARPQVQRPINISIAHRGPFQRPVVTAMTQPFVARGTQVRVMRTGDCPPEKVQCPAADAMVYRLPKGRFTGATAIADRQGIPYRTDALGYLQGRAALAATDQLVALLPMPPVSTITFTNQYNYFLISAEPISTGLAMQQVGGPGLITLTIPTVEPSTPVPPGNVSGTHPFVLFNLTVSLEWDATDDELFRSALTDSFQKASALLYDVTDGQVAIGRVDVFPAKTFWNRADIAIHAGNSLRPSAAIGGVVNAPVGEQVRPAFGQPASKPINTAYVPGQIRMGTAWDPFGEEAQDLGEQWWRALAHELAHHLLFLPDNYLGFKLDTTTTTSDKRILGRVNCQGSFMTTTFDPSYTEFLKQEQWQGDCLQTLAEQTTARTDWATITHFYPMLKSPAQPLEGPSLLPLDVTRVHVWPLQGSQPTLPARYFQLRDSDGEIIRLPTAQVYLFQTQGTDDPTDDLLLSLGSPTGGGDRIKVRGAKEGDRLCLFDFGAADNTTYSGCIDQLSAANVSIPVHALQPQTGEARWLPVIDVHALTTRTLLVTVTQELAADASLQVQLFPAHYPSAPGIAVTRPLTLTGEGYVGQVNLPYPAAELFVRVWVDDGSHREAIAHFNLRLPWKTGDKVMGGPDNPVLGGPDNPVLGGPDNPVLGGPDNPVLGGPDNPVLGGPDNPVLGGPDNPVLGGPDYPIVGGASQHVFAAPMISADAQVIIYNQAGAFEPNGIRSLQILPSPPNLYEAPWLTPVGQAYDVVLDPDFRAARTVAVTYFQRDIPAGYEHTLAIYYLPKGGTIWERLPTRQFVENLLIADLQQNSGTYAAMSTISLPPLNPGYNLFTYPLPDRRGIASALASLEGQYSELYVVAKDGRIEPPDDVFEFGQVYLIRIDGTQTVVPYLAPPRVSPDGTVPGVEQ